MIFDYHIIWITCVNQNFSSFSLTSTPRNATYTMARKNASFSKNRNFSFDLPIETWEGQPSSDTIFVERRLQAASKSYVFLSMATREGPSMYDERCIINMEEWAMENGSNKYWREFIVILQGGRTPMTLGTSFVANTKGCFHKMKRGSNFFLSPVFVREVKTDHEEKIKSRQKNQLLSAWRQTGRPSPHQADVLKSLRRTQRVVARRSMRACGQSRGRSKSFMAESCHETSANPIDPLS